MRFGGAAARVGVSLVLLSLSFGEPRAAKLPDWAEAIAETTKPVPEGVPEHSSRVLLSEVRCTVAPDGTLRIRKRLAEQILSAAAPELDFGFFRFDETAKMTSTKAWHVVPGDNAKRSWMSPVDLGVGDVFLSDLRIRVKAVPGIRKGSLVFFEFEATDKPYFLMLRHLYFEGAPIALGRFELQTPPGWTVHWEWLRTPGPEPVETGDLHSWEVRDPPLAEAEPLGPSPIDQAPSLVVSAVPPEGVKLVVPVFENWSDFSSWYDDLIGVRHGSTPAIENAARNIYAGTGTDFFAKVGAAGRFVRDGVRYVAVELGIGGFQPKVAGETLSSLLGDCKDKATLFRAMLSVAEIRSHAMLINTASDDTVTESLPVYGFNHLIVAIPVPDGVDPPPVFAPAMMDGGDLGRLLIVDTTDERTSIGSLSAALSGKKGLLVAGPRGRLITLPIPGSETHRVERRLAFELQSDRSFGIERLSTYRGQFASGARSDYSQSSTDRRKGVEKRVLELWPDAQVLDYSAQPETPEATFVEKISARLKPIPAIGPGATMALFPGAVDEIRRVPLGRRKTLVEYDHPMSIRYAVVLRPVPDTRALPAAQNLAGDGWSVRTTFERTGPVVTATWEVSLARTRFTPEEFPELRKFWSAVTASAGGAVNLGQ